MLTTLKFQLDNEKEVMNLLSLIWTHQNALMLQEFDNTWHWSGGVSKGVAYFLFW